MEGSKKWSTTGIGFVTNNVLVYLNYLTVGLNSYISLFAGDAKLLRKIRNHMDCEGLENVISKI